MQQTLILIKPDAFSRGLTGEILARFERKGLTIIALKLVHASREIAQTHYAEHTEKPFFPALVDFIVSGSLVAVVLEGEDAIGAVRQLIGATDPLDAAPGTIRADLASQLSRNLVHGADKPESAAREISVWFPELR